MAISATQTVRDLAIEVPGATRLFETFGIDYCCGGAKTLGEACAATGIEVDELVRALEQTGSRAIAENEAHDWRNERLTALISYIVYRHHEFDREELDRIEPLLEKVRWVYGDQHSELAEIQQVFGSLKRDLLEHMSKEEHMLFPYINHLELAAEGAGPKPIAPFGTVQNPVRMMMSEHDNAGELLQRLRQLSRGFAVPSDACISYRSLYQALEGLERDVHQHMHLENNLLFPRAIELEG